jgi:hypothetical protein
MTPDERALLSDFLRDLGQASVGARDPEADRMINDTLRARPEAAYVLVQHAILADQALRAAQARIGELERQASGGASFLGAAPPRTSVPPSGAYDPRQAYGASQGYAPGPAYAAPPQGGLFSPGGGLGSFLRSAGTTAAGVAGGEMLFSGLANLFGGHRGGGFWGGGGYYDGPPEVIENVTVNDYGDGGGFGDDPYGGGGGGGDWSDN